MISHQRAQRDARVLVSQGLSTGRHQALRAHLRGCDDCMRHYERLRGVEDALAPPGEVMAPQAFERLGALVLDGVAPAPKRNVMAWLGAFSAATAVAVVMLVVVPQQRNDEFASRGATVSDAPYGLSLFVIDPATQHASRAEIQAQHVTIPSGRAVQLAYRNGNAHYLVVVGVDAKGDSELYYPGDGEHGTGGVRLVTGAVDEPLPGAWNLDEVATPLRLVAFFSDEPIDSEAALAEAKRAGGRPTLLIDVAKR